MTESVSRTLEGKEATARIEGIQSSAVTVIIPTYNERENIRDVISKCRNALEGHDFEIIVVDDDSPDRTWKVVREEYPNDDDVRVIRRTRDSDLATAICYGFREATNEFCAVLDADLQHPPDKLGDLFVELERGADIAVASRYISDGAIESWSWKRRVISRGATLFAQFWLPPARNVADPVSGFFAVRRDVVRDMKLDPRGYKILLEIIVKSKGADIIEVPYRFSERANGSSNLALKEYTQFLRHTLSLYRSHR